MRNLMLIAAAAALVPASAALPLPSGTAQAKQSAHPGMVKRCRASKGTTGLIAGGVAGAVVGGSVIGGGVVGPLVGAAGGALAGRAIDRSITAKKRCTWVKA